MLFPEFAQDLINQPPGSTRTQFGPLQPEDFQVQVGDETVQTALQRNSDGSFVLVNSKGEVMKMSNGQPFAFTGPSDVNVRFLVPMLHKKQQQGNAGS